MSDFALLTQAIENGDRDNAKLQTKIALESGVGPQAILDALIEGMNDIGRRFKCDEIFVPEVLMAARAMKESLALLEPRLTAAGIKPEFTIVIGTVAGDLRDIGKNLVAMMWKGANFNVIDLGINVAPAKFVEAARKHNAKLIGLSALLTTTMPAMKKTVEEIRAADLPGVKVIIGGAPVTKQYADEIGADGYSPDAASAVDAARSLLAAQGVA